MNSREVLIAMYYAYRKNGLIGYEVFIGYSLVQGGDYVPKQHNTASFELEVHAFISVLFCKSLSPLFSFL